MMPKDGERLNWLRKSNHIKLLWAFPCNDRANLWNYTQMLIEINPIKALAPQHVKWRKISSSSIAQKQRRRFLLPPCTGGGFLHQKNSWQINALPLGLIKLEGIKTTERLLWWTQCCASCAPCSGGNFCHLAFALPAAPRWTRSNTVKFL